MLIKSRAASVAKHGNRKVHSARVNVVGMDFVCVRVSRRGGKQSPARTTDVVMDTTDENKTRIALVSFSGRLALQLMLTLKTFRVGKKKHLLCGSFTQQE